MERGGPTVQAGITFQNGVAAFYLADLLSYDRDERDRVVEVRVEAPTHVDDIVIDYADGRHVWCQVKLALAAGTGAWTSLWEAFAAQGEECSFGPADRLRLILGEDTTLIHTLADCCERALNADDGEWRSRMTGAQRALIEQIEMIVGGSAFPIFSRLDITIELETGFSEERLRRRLPPSNVSAKNLHDALRAIAGAGGRHRTIFHAPQLRAELREDCGISIDPPADWGVAAYLAALGEGVIAVPGTSVGGQAHSTFAWPRTSRFASLRRDFDDEQVLEMLGNTPPVIDLRLFPSPELFQAIIYAGPGFGKSALLVALAQKLAVGGVVAPAIVSLAALADSGREIVDYLNVNLNADYGVRIDWERLVETGGAALLFDGLDEVPLAARSAVVARLGRFTARWRKSPWLLTVRDPALVPVQLDVQKIELLPLLDEDMPAFVKMIRPSVTDRNLERMSSQLDAYPDIRRLARIPLFLALIAAMLDREEDLPRRRGDLIEAYLKTLFRPEEHKETSRTADPERLRAMLQELAFDLLSTGSVGAEERTIRRLFAREATQEVTAERLFDDALRCGILRRQTTTRLSFPFPIVQEYLAAQELLDRRPSEIADLVATGIDRPWAQTLQFALEGLPDASDIVRALLALEEDIFASRARLVARCIVNGMYCAPELREEVGVRLVAAWPDQGFWTERRIGQLLRDGWTKPLAQPLREALHDRSIFHGGGEGILADVEDDALTMSVLPSLLEDSAWTVHLGEFQAAVNRVSGFAFQLYLQIWVTPPLDVQRSWRIATLIRRLDGARIDRDLLDRTAKDGSLPTAIRLATLQLLDQPDQTLLRALIRQSLVNADKHDDWMTCHAISVVDDPEGLLASLLRSSDLAPEAHETIVEHIADALPDEGRRTDFLNLQARDTALTEELRLSIRMRLMTLGDIEAFESLVDDFAILPEDCIRPVIWCVNKAPEKRLGAKLLSAMRARLTEPASRASHIDDLIVGATHKVDVFSRDGAAMDPAPPHPSYDAFVDLVAEWRDEGGFSLEDQLRVETLAAQVQLSGAAQTLLTMTEKAIQAIDLEEGEAPLRYSIQAALRRLSSFPDKLPLLTVVRLLRASDTNLRSDAASYIATIGSRASLDVLLDQVGHRSVYRANLMADIEMAANRVGVRIVRTTSGFEVAEPA